MIGAAISKFLSRRAFDCLNRKDVEGFLSHWHDDAVFHYPGTLAVSGDITGKEAIRAWFTKLFERFPTISFKVKGIYVRDIFALGPSNAVAVEFDMDATLEDGRSYTNNYVVLLQIRGGKTVDVREFSFDYETLKKSWGE